MKDFVKKILSEDNGNPSSMRLISIGVTILGCTILAVEVACKIWFTHTRGSYDFPIDWAWAITLISAGMGGKILAKVQESKAE